MTQAILKAAVAALAVLPWSIPAAAAGVDPALLALAAPDSRTLAGIQVGQAQSTPLGQSLMGQIQLDPNATRALAEAGFDLRRDLREILVSVTGTNSGDATVLGRGSFHPDKIAAAAHSAGASLSTYRGVQLIEARGIGQGGAGQGGVGQGRAASLSGSLAFLDSSTMLAGDTTAVKAAIDRHAANAAFNGPLADRARQFAAANDLWLVTLPLTQAAAPSASAAQFGPLGNILSAAVQLSAGIKITAAQVTLSADVLARTPQDAQSFADILKFAVQMMQANRPDGSPAPQGPSLADAAKISVAGSTMHLILSVPEKQLEPLFASPGPPKRLAQR